MLRAVSKLLKNAKPLVQRRSMGWVDYPHKWNYRTLNSDIGKDVKFWAEVHMFVMWYWVLWHFYYESGHYTHHHPMPDPKKFTDEELGVPTEDMFQ